MITRSMTDIFRKKKKKDSENDNYDDDDDDSGISDDKYQYTEVEIFELLNALTKNMVFDIGFRTDDIKHKKKCWCPCW